MARDFAPNYTPRYKISYIVGSKKHSLMVRLQRGADSAAVTAVAGKMGQFLAAIQGAMFSDFTVLGAKYAQMDSDIFLPAVAPTSPVGAVPATSRTGNKHAQQGRFEGQSEGGSRVNFSLYGLAYSLDTSYVQDYRIQTTEDPPISQAVGVLNEISPHLYGIDTEIAHWYPYMNLKPNDYYVHRARS